MTKISPENFDRHVAGKPDRIWGARAIAAYLCLSEDTVRRWAKDPAVPIYNPTRGTFFASRQELETWLRQKPAA